MVDAGNQIASSAQPLDYAGRMPPRVRTSRLAIAALVVAILGSPCLLGRFSNWINWYVPREFNQVGRYGFVHFYFIRGGMIAATVLPLVAILRIALSRARRGFVIAVIALLISLIWWGLLWVASVMWSGWRMH